MADIEGQLRRSETGDPTQAGQDRVVGQLEKVIRQAQQAMREQQQQQQAAAGQQPGKPSQEQGAQPGGNKPAQRSFAPLSGVKNGPLADFDKRGRGFGSLSDREQQAMKQGRQERVPAEYRELVNQYYKALSERSNK